MAGIRQSKEGHKHMYLSVLLGLTANSYPNVIDPAFFQKNIGMRARYGMHRRPPDFQTYRLTCDPLMAKTWENLELILSL
eukprot:2200094-Ditylum_brightwellii.AAC.1